MAERSWQMADADVQSLIAARHGDPFQVLGPHETPQGLAIRAFVPHATSVEVIDSEGKAVATLALRDGAGLFEGLVPRRKTRFPYRLRASNAAASWELDDPYSFGPVLGPMDDYLVVEGTHRQLYNRLGAHRRTLALSLLAQASMVVFAGVIAGAIMMALISPALNSLGVSFSFSQLGVVGIGAMIVGWIGSLAAVLRVLRIEPINATLPPGMQR